MTLRRFILLLFVSYINFCLPNSHAETLKYTITGNATAVWPGGPLGLYHDQIADFYGLENPVTGFSFNVPIQVELIIDTSIDPTLLNDQPYIPGTSLDGFGEALYRDFMISASVSLNGHVFNNIRPFATTQVNEQEALIVNSSVSYSYGFMFLNAHSIIGSSLFFEETIPLNGTDDLDVSIGLLRFSTLFLADSVDNLLIPNEINYQDAFFLNLSFNLDTCINADCSLKDTVMNVGSADIVELSIVPVDADTDGDLVPDGTDNCTHVINADQRDTDGDGYGNLCDPDLNNDGVVNFADVALWVPFFNTANMSDEDFNGDGAANFGDYALFPQYFLQPPGPSGVAP